MNDQLLLNIGKKIRSLRQKQNLKIHELADKSNISKGLLSKIENGRTVPSLPVLIAIIRSLKVEMDVFFEGIYSGNGNDYIHIKKQDYEIIEKEEAVGFSYRSVFSRNIADSSMEIVLLDLLPDSYREPVTTDGFEFKFMLKGEVIYQLGNDEVILKEGDSLFFNGKIPHVPINRNRETATLLVVYFLHPTHLL